MGRQKVICSFGSRAVFGLHQRVVVCVYGLLVDKCYCRLHVRPTACYVHMLKGDCKRICISIQIIKSNYIYNIATVASRFYFKFTF